MPQLPLDRAILERLLEYASKVACLVGIVIEGGLIHAGFGDRIARELAVGPLEDHVDLIAHILSELLGILT